MMIESYAEASAANRSNLEELKRIAQLGQRQAQAVGLWSLAAQDWILAANACLEIHLRYKEALDRHWYELGAPYDRTLEEELIGGLRKLVEESDQLISDASTLKEMGHPVQGVEIYRSNVTQAKGILEDDVIRKQAERLMPSIEKLDALADAHRRPIGS